MLAALGKEDGEKGEKKKKGGGESGSMTIRGGRRWAGDEGRGKRGSQSENKCDFSCR